MPELVRKPVFMTPEQIEKLKDFAHEHRHNPLIVYNARPSESAVVRHLIDLFLVDLSDKLNRIDVSENQPAA